MTSTVKTTSQGAFQETRHFLLNQPEPINFNTQNDEKRSWLPSKVNRGQGGAWQADIF